MQWIVCNDPNKPLDARQRFRDAEHEIELAFDLMHRYLTRIQFFLHALQSPILISSLRLIFCDRLGQLFPLVASEIPTILKPLKVLLELSPSGDVPIKHVELAATWAHDRIPFYPFVRTLPTRNNATLGFAFVKEGGFLLHSLYRLDDEF